LISWLWVKSTSDIVWVNQGVEIRQVPLFESLGIYPESEIIEQTDFGKDPLVVTIDKCELT